MKPSPSIVLLLLAASVGFAQAPTPAPVNPLLVAGFYDGIGKSLRNPKKTTPIGSVTDGNPFTALPGEGAVLVGFAVNQGDWFGTPIISALQPIYETRTGRSRGATVGKKVNDFPLVAEAKPGYVVSQLLVSAPHDHVHGIKVIFRKLDLFHRGVVAKDSYESDWLGIAYNDKSQRVGDPARPAIGLCGRADEWVAALGLLHLP